MEWKEALFTLGNNVISNDSYQAILNLPLIRDKVFLKDYAKFGYVGLEPEYFEFRAGVLYRGIRIWLSSNRANRVIHLTYILSHDKNKLGKFDDSIFLLDKDKGFGISINIKILAEKRKLPFNASYNSVDFYEGSIVEKHYECMKAIKETMDNVANDIIRGEAWDNKAYLESYS